MDYPYFQVSLVWALFTCGSVLSDRWPLLWPFFVQNSQKTNYIFLNQSKTQAADKTELQLKRARTKSSPNLWSKSKPFKYVSFRGVNGGASITTCPPSFRKLLAPLFFSHSHTQSSRMSWFKIYFKNSMFWFTF